MNMVVQKQIDHVPHHLFAQRPCSNSTLVPHFESELQACTLTMTHPSISHTVSQLIKGLNLNSAQHHHFVFIFLLLPTTYSVDKR